MVPSRPLFSYARAGKRSLDVLASAAGIAALSPALAATALVVRLSFGSPVLFRQRRPGRGGREFSIYKFRTMTDERGPDGELLPDAERLTRTGRLLRSLSVDELPELFCVLLGDMSLVGPRPLLPRYTRWFTPTERRRLDVRPGITGLAQISGRNQVSWDRRLQLDVDYVDNLGLREDLRILLLTALRVVRRDGLDADPTASMQDLDVERQQRVRP